MPPPELEPETERHLRAEIEREAESRRELESAHQQLDLLYRLMDAVSSAESIDSTFEAALDGIAGTLGTARASILLTDDDGVMRFRAARGLSSTCEHALEAYSPWKRDDTYAAPIVVDDVSRDAAMQPYREIFAQEQIDALAFLPLVHSGRLLGELVLYYRAPHRFTADAKLAIAIARHVAISVGRQQGARARAWLQAIIESSNDAIVTKTLEGIVTSWNAGAERLFGYTSDEMIGRPITVLFPPDRLNEEELILTRMRRGERVDHFETVRVRKDGTPIDISVTISPIVDAHGAILGVSKIARDISERRAFEQERERLRDTFIGVLGHDLRNPLNAIAMGAALLLRAEDLPANYSKLAARIARSADMMMVIVRDVLDFAQGRMGGGIPVSPAPCDLEEICRRAVEEAEIANPLRSLAVETRGSLAGHWDAGRLHQAISNLVGNAVKHGRDPIRVVAEPRDGEVVVEVHNHGDPIPEQVLATIFEPFQSTDRRQGLGLGLFIVSEIAHAHGGSVAVRSTAEDGTVVTLRLPRRP